MHATTPQAAADTAAKLPAVTLGFWITKILATTMGETGGDAVSMSMGFGYLASTILFFVAFLATVGLQIATRRFKPAVYWRAVIASTTVGTTLADFADRSLGIGYPGGATLLLGLTLGSLFAWHRALGSIDVATVVDARSEAWYWVTIMFSQTLGTALGDWTADSVGLGYGGAALVFAGLLTLVALALAFTRVSRTALFWTAFVLTRPLGAVVGDFLDKPLAEGGLALSRYTATGVLFAAIAVLVLLLPQRAAYASAR
jgi:uncharacterized membrane-anchored protein